MVLALLGTAFLLNGKIQQYLTDPEDVKDYARFMVDYQQTHLGVRLKHMSSSIFA